MKPRRVDDALYVHFVTFSCYHRRKLLTRDQPKRIMLGVLADELERHHARCVGYVIMQDHVHILLWLPVIQQLSRFMQLWKGRSSRNIKNYFAESAPAYQSEISARDPIWQVRYYSFEIYTDQKLQEKLQYLHLNPVRAGLAKKAVDWRWSSAQWYEQGRTVGVPISWVE